jgi:hypothetical protein
MTVTGVSHGGEPKGRDDITVGHTWVPLRVYRTDGFPTIFAGFQVNWIEGEDPETHTPRSTSAPAPGLGRST